MSSSESDSYLELMLDVIGRGLLGRKLSLIQAYASVPNWCLLWLSQPCLASKRMQRMSIVGESWSLTSCKSDMAAGSSHHWIQACVCSSIITVDLWLMDRKRLAPSTAACRRTVRPSSTRFEYPFSRSLLESSSNDAMIRCSCSRLESLPCRPSNCKNSQV